MAHPAASALVVLVAASRAAALAEGEPLFGCLRWQGHGGCDAITDKDACLGSRDGRPWKQWQGYKISGEPCAWCGGQPCVEGSDALCAPRALVEDLPGIAVANCSAGFETFPDMPPAGDDVDAGGIASAGEFETSAGGEGFRCSADYLEESKEYNDFFFTFTASSLAACKAICVEEDFCTGVEFSAQDFVCRVWWHAISSMEPADGHSCARRANRSTAAASSAQGGLTPEQAAAIGGGVAGAVAGAGLAGGLSLPTATTAATTTATTAATTTATTTTTLVLSLKATVVDKTLAVVVDRSARSTSHWGWGLLLGLGLLCATLGLVLTFSGQKATMRSVTLDYEDESPCGRAEAGLAGELATREETPLRWPEWLTRPLGKEGAAHVPGTPFHVVRRAGPDETYESRTSLLARAPLSNSPTPPPVRAPVRSTPAAPRSPPLFSRRPELPGRRAEPTALLRVEPAAFPLVQRTAPDLVEPLAIE